MSEVLHDNAYLLCVLAFGQVMFVVGMIFARKERRKRERRERDL